MLDRVFVSDFIDKINDNTKLIKNLVDKVSDAIVNNIDTYSQEEYLNNIDDAILALTSKLNHIRTHMEPLLKKLAYAVVKDIRYKDTELKETLLEFIVVIRNSTDDIVSLVENATKAVSSFDNTVEYDKPTMNDKLLYKLSNLIDEINTAYKKIIEFATKAKTALLETPRNGGRMMTRHKYKKSNRMYKKGLTKRSRTYKKGLTKRSRK